MRADPQHLDDVVLVDELQPGVVAEHGRQHRQREVRGERAVRGRAQDVGEPEHAHGDVRAAPREAAHIALDLDGVLGEAATGQRLGRGRLGEDRRIAGRRTVDVRTGLHDQPPDAGGLLAGAQQLHGPDDVGLLQRRPAGAAQRRPGDVEVDDRVGARLGEHPRDGGLPDVRLDEVGAAQVVLGRNRVHADDPVHLGVPQDPPDKAASQLPGHPGHEHDLSQDQRLPLALLPTANLSGHRRSAEPTGCPS